MGVIRSVADYYEQKHSTPTLYGGSGHAFLANIHNALCPSGPYVWRYDSFFRLLNNLGIGMTDLGFLHPGSSPDERENIEKRARELIADGVPCSILNLENQLIYACDDIGFLTAQPWGPMDDMTPPRLTFGSWEELGKEYHMNFFSFHKSEPVESKRIVIDSLAYAMDLYSNPTAYSREGYGVGPRAYVKWISAVKNGHGDKHGAWWNAMVWSECRSMASKYLEEAASLFPEACDAFAGLSGRYHEISKLLNSAGDKEMPAPDKLEVLAKAESQEAAAIDEIALLSSQIHV